MIIEEEWWSSMLKGFFRWLTHSLSPRVCVNTLGKRWSRGIENDRSAANEEGYAEMYANREMKNEDSPIIMLYCILE